MNFVATGKYVVNGQKVLLDIIATTDSATIADLALEALENWQKLIESNAEPEHVVRDEPVKIRFVTKEATAG